MSHPGMRFYFWKKHSEIIIDLQATKFLVPSEAHHLLVICDVYLDLLKAVAALLRVISPFPAFLSLFLEIAVCLYVMKI